MGWISDRLGSRGAPQDVAVRLSGNLLRLKSERAELSDRNTVQAWLRELRPEHETQVFVHRSWGTVLAVADRNPSVQVFLYDGDKTWWAAAPGSPDEQHLTPEQVEHILLDALASPARPSWPDWRYLV